jgi:2,5-diamino-6-(ribosylamino)-4(3H)-pyrimidinone 5'-phosphate reductase
MLMSLDGKISTGSIDERDFDKDLPTIKNVGAGLHQYYELEQKTDYFSFNTGKVMAKVGWNERKTKIEPVPVIFVLVDNEPHLTNLGVANLMKFCEKLYIITTNNQHPALKISNEKLEVIKYPSRIDFNALFQLLKSKGAAKLTVQSGGEMNAVLLRAGLINALSIVVVPLLVGGRSTSTLVDGESLQSFDDLKKLRPLKLVEAKPLADNYLHLRYEVI